MVSFSLFSRVDAPPGYHALNALRLLAIVGVLAAVMPTVAHLTDGVQVSGMIHPSICTWSIGIAGSFLVGQIIGTSVWKVIGPTARQWAPEFVTIDSRDLGSEAERSCGGIAWMSEFEVIDGLTEDLERRALVFVGRDVEHHLD